MPNIRCVCLSDMHLGAETSPLTNLKEGQSEPDPSKPSPVLERLAKYLRSLIDQNEDKDKSQKPKLILNGDILELALAAVGVAESELSRTARSESVNFSVLVFRLRNPFTSMDLLRLLPPT